SRSRRARTPLPRRAPTRPRHRATVAPRVTRTSSRATTSPATRARFATTTGSACGWRLSRTRPRRRTTVVPAVVATREAATTRRRRARMTPWSIADDDEYVAINEAADEAGIPLADFIAILTMDG